MENEAAYDELTQKIIGLCFEVHNTLGSGFIEKIYVNALKIKLQQNNLLFEAERNSL